ncbi:MAG: hypothetical protein HKN43_01790 [Rhodothermales bacterium]|nr:hypothetical protein [Rhodothermales bacterium]
MVTVPEWMELLDKIISLRNSGAEFDRLHKELSKEAARVDFTFLTLVMSGEFESARKYLQSIGWEQADVQ